MTPEKDPKLSLGWLRAARADFAHAGMPLLPDDLWEVHCFHAQQCAEKAIKAVYVKRNTAFSFTHDLERLLSGLEAKGELIPPAVKASVALTSYAVESRYPARHEAVTEAEAQAALGMAKAVLDWASLATAK